MKLCTYCGRENEDVTIRCMECGTDQWKTPVASSLEVQSKGNSGKNLSLLASLAGVFFQVWGLLSVLARNLSELHSNPKSAGSIKELFFIYGGWILTFVGLSFYAKAKGRSWFWSLFALFPFAGFIISAMILLCLPDRSKR